MSLRDGLASVRGRRILGVPWCARDNGCLAETFFRVVLCENSARQKTDIEPSERTIPFFHRPLSDYTLKACDYCLRRSSYAGSSQRPGFQHGTKRRSFGADDDV